MVPSLYRGGRRDVDGNERTEKVTKGRGNGQSLDLNGKSAGKCRLENAPTLRGERR